MWLWDESHQINRLISGRVPDLGEEAVLAGRDEVVKLCDIAYRKELTNDDYTEDCRMYQAGG